MNSSNPNSGNLKDMEAKINSLERANFDLKLKLHYLNKKYPKSGENDDGNQKNGTVDTSGVDIVTLKEENDYSKRRIVELESELLQLQLLRDRESHEYQKALKLAKTPASHTNDETRKREREVAQAIAEHDAALIKKLQEEIIIYQKQREKDKELIDSLTTDLSHTRLLLEEKEKVTTELTEKNKDLTLKIELIREERDYDDTNGGNGIIPFSGHGSPMKRGAGGRNSANQGPPMMFSANTNGQQTQILINSAAFTAATSVPPPSSSGAPSPYHPAYRQGQAAPQPSTFLLQTHPSQQSMANASYYHQQQQQQQQHQSQLNNSFNSSMLDGMNTSINQTMNNPYNNPYGNPPLPPNGMGHGPHDLPIYQENAVLKDRLWKLQESIQNQEKIIFNMKTSAKEFNSIESEEIKRLENELDKIIDEKEKLKQKYQKIEVELEITTQQLQQYHRYYGPLDISAISSSNPFGPHHLAYGGRMNQNQGNGPNVVNNQHHMLEIQQYEKTLNQYK
jgi:hypothetical protein